MTHLSQDDILCQMHEEHMREIEMSGLPAHLAEAYGSYPVILTHTKSDDEQLEYRRKPGYRSSVRKIQKSKTIRPKRICGKFTTYSRKCSNKFFNLVRRK